MSSPYALLDQADEDALHASRLLNIEEKLYKRLSKRLLTAESLFAPISDPLTALVDETDVAALVQTHEVLPAQDDAHRAWREDMLLDFAAFESNIVRVQFLLESNERERDRYASEKLRILDAAQTVKDGNARLHDQLNEARKTLTLRKTYDDLADKITSNRALRPRDEQEVQNVRLNREIEELEREKMDYANTWVERREQFGKIVEEGVQMLRLIRDEKEEAERKEGMDDIEEGEGSGGVSGIATPRATEGAATPLLTIVDGENTFSPTSPSAVRDPHVIQSHAKDIQMTDEHTRTPDNILEVPTSQTKDDGELEEGEQDTMNVDP